MIVEPKRLCKLLKSLLDKKLMKKFNVNFYKKIFSNLFINFRKENIHGLLNDIINLIKRLQANLIP